MPIIDTHLFIHGIFYERYASLYLTALRQGAVAEATSANRHGSTDCFWHGISGE